MIKQLKPVTLFALISLTACDNLFPDADNHAPVANETQTENTSTTPQPSSSTLVEQLQGTWIKPCGIASSPEDDEAFYDIVVTTFDGHNWTSDIRPFTDASCTTPLPYAPNPTASGTFSIGDTVMTVNNIAATATDSHTLEYNGAPFEIREYDIFYIDGNRMYIGDDIGDLDASSPARRPNSLDPNRIFYRQ